MDYLRIFSAGCMKVGSQASQVRVTAMRCFKKTSCPASATLQELIGPIRERGAEPSGGRGYDLEVIKEGMERARKCTEATKRDVVNTLGLFQM